MLFLIFRVLPLQPQNERELLSRFFGLKLRTSLFVWIFVSVKKSQWDSSMVFESSFRLAFAAGGKGPVYMEVGDSR